MIKAVRHAESFVPQKLAEGRMRGTSGVTGPSITHLSRHAEHDLPSCARETMRRTICVAVIAITCCLAVTPSAGQDAATANAYLPTLKQAEETAETYREASADEQPGLKTKVIELVTQSFEVRQRAQTAQLEKMRKKLREAEKAIEAREELKQRIIDRKVEDLLSGQSADWKSTAETEAIAFDVIEIGDIVMVYIEGVLPYTPPNQAPAQPPVNVLRSGRIATGFPIPVGSDGKIPLPLVDPIKVAGLSVRQAEAAIAKTYIDQNVLRPDKAKPMLTLIPKAESQFAVVNATENAVVPPPVQSSPAVQNISASSSNFDDTYGRLEKAKQLVEQIRSAEKKIAATQKQIRETQKTIDALQTGSTSDHPGNQRLTVRNLETQLSALVASQQAFNKTKETAVFRLELERDYLIDLVERSKTEMRISENRLLNAERSIERQAIQVQSGTGTQDALLKAEGAKLEVEASMQKARQEFDQAERILDRWKKIVGKPLGESR